MEVYNAIKSVMPALAFIALIINVVYLYYILIRRKHESASEFFGANSLLTKPGVIVIIEVVFVLGVFFSKPIYSKLENTNIGSFFEKESYKECYYVYIRPNDKYQKSYRVKADIIKGSYGYFDYNDDGDEIYVSLGNGYFLEKIYWDNGGYITFLNEGDYPTVVEHARLYPGKENRVTDENDKEYFVTLTSEKVE